MHFSIFFFKLPNFWETKLPNFEKQNYQTLVRFFMSSSLGYWKTIKWISIVLSQKKEKKKKKIRISIEYEHLFKFEPIIINHQWFVIKIL